MLMEEDRESQLQRKGRLKRLLHLFILWVLCVTSAVVTLTSGNGEFKHKLQQCLLFSTLFEYNIIYSAVKYLKVTLSGESI